MNDVIVKQMPAFKRAYKRLHAKQKTQVNCAIREVIANPKIGQEKKSDLAGVFVYQFKTGNQQVILAYEFHGNERLLLALGIHENFYRDLKKRIN